MMDRRCYLYSKWYLFVVVVLCGSLSLSGCSTNKTSSTSSPTSSFSFREHGFPYLDPDIDQSFFCPGLSMADIKKVLLPLDTYYVDRNNSFKPVGYCYVNMFVYNGENSAMYGITVSSLFGRADLPAVYNAPIVDNNWMKEHWDSHFVYRFPESYGWGGALWTQRWGSLDSNSGYWPLAAVPNNGNDAWSVLCSNPTNCLGVHIYPGDFWGLKPDASGRLDPIEVAVSLLEKAWRNLSVSRPDFIPYDVPDVNPSPYVPDLQVPPSNPFGTYPPYNTPTASESTSASSSPSGVAVPSTGPTS